MTVIAKQPASPHVLTWGSITGSQFFFAPPIPVVPNTTSVVPFIGGSDGNWYCVSAPTLGATASRAAVRPRAAASGNLLDVTLSTDLTVFPPSVAKPGEAFTVIARQLATPHNLIWGTITGSQFYFAPTIPLFGNTTSTVPFVGDSDGNWYCSGIPILGA